MNTTISLEKCEAFINSQFQTGGIGRPLAPSTGRPKSITLSRQSGSGGHVVAEELTRWLQANSPAGGRPWTVFDRNLVERVLEDHHLPKRLAHFMAEDRMSEISDTLDELFGLHPQSWTLVRQTADTMLRLVELGNVILIGRGAAAVAGKLSSVVHVRLVAPIEQRVDYIQRLENLSVRKAREFVEKEDIGRRRYLKKYFGKDIEDPLLYHLTINTHLTGYAEAARIIGEFVLGDGRAKAPAPAGSSKSVGAGS